MDNPMLPIIYRKDVAVWYGIKEDGLRKRFAKKQVDVTNRILTISDLKHIIDKLGEPPFLPTDIYDIIYRH